MRVVTRDGGDPLAAYAARIPRHGSTARHREVLTALLGGQSVTVSDSEIAAPDGGAAPVTILIRFRGDRFRTRLVVRPMTQTEHDAHCPSEVRPVPPTVDNWRRQVTRGVRWELYSCVVEGLFSDRVS